MGKLFPYQLITHKIIVEQCLRRLEVFLISICLLIVGVLLAQLIEEGVMIVFVILTIPFIGGYLIRRREKYCGIGMIASSIVLGILVFMGFLVSQLH